MLGKSGDVNRSNHVCPTRMERTVASQFRDDTNSEPASTLRNPTWPRSFLIPPP